MNTPEDELVQQFAASPCFPFANRELVGQVAKAPGPRIAEGQKTSDRTGASFDMRFGPPA